MAIRRFNILHLIEGGYRLIPGKVIIDYAYNQIIGLEKQAYVNIYGTCLNADPKTICLASTLYIPIDSGSNMSRFATSIIDLKDLEITGIWIEIVNSEFLDIERIDITTRNASIPTGTEAQLDNGLPRIISYTINDGSIFSVGQTVALNNVCVGSPTHCRYSKYSDFGDTQWTTYSISPLFDLYSVGVNRIYFQVKNNIGESNILYREVGWHGYEEAIITERFEVGNVFITDYIGTYNDPEIHNIITESFVIADQVVNENIVITLNGVEV